MVKSKRRFCSGELSRHPQQITKFAWYYEERRGVTLIHQIVSEDGRIGTETIVIPWKLLAESFKRYRKAIG